MKPSRRKFLLSAASALSLPAFLRADDAPRVREVSWLAEVQQPAQPFSGGSARLSPLLVDDRGQPIRSLDEWKRRRTQLRQAWFDFLKPWERRQTPPPALKINAEERLGNVVRRLVQYEVEPGLPVEAYLLRPERLATRSPGVVVFHSTTDDNINQPAGVQGQKEKAFGLALAQRGWVAFCPCNFLWPQRGKIATKQAVDQFRARHPGSKGMAKMLHDAQTALDILVGLPEVDPQRIGAVGHSLGAKEVLYLAAFDERVTAAVSSEGGIGTRFSNWEAPWYLGDEIRQSGFTREHHELLALAAPRAFLLLGGDSADGERGWPFINAARPVYELYGRPARLGLFNHRRGHSVPPEAERRLYSWLETYV
jgi:dienelactone hydrolase